MVKNMTDEEVAAGVAAAGARAWPVAEGYVDADGVPIYFKCIGAGRPLLILHGGPGANHDYLLQPLLPLAKWRQLVFIDQRGCGRSGSPWGSSEYTIQRQTRDIEQVRTSLGLGRIDVLGHSFGGLVAQAYALAYPQSVASLLLVATASSIDRVERDLDRILRAAPPELQSEIAALETQGIYGVDGAQLPRYRQCADEILAPCMYAVHAPTWDSQPTSFGWEAMRQVWGDQSEFRCTGTARALDLDLGMQAWPGRALIVYGDHDIVSDATASHTHLLIKRSRLVRIKDAGHELYVDQPAAFIETIESFLRAPDRP